MSYDSTKSIYLIKLFEVLEELGLETAELQANSGLTDEELQDREGSIALPKYIDAIEGAMRTYDVPDLGFLVGERTTPLEHGVLGYALLSSPNLRECLHRYVRFQYMQGPLLDVSFDDTETMASLSANPLRTRWHVGPAAHKYLVQEWLVGWNQWCRLIGHSGSLFEHVRLAYKSQNRNRYYEQHLGCTVSFDNDETTAFFPSRFLDRPMEFADESIAALCSVQCERLLEVLNLRTGLVAEVHRQLAATPGTVPDMGTMATRLRIGERTLRRRLNSEGTTYQRVVTDFRIAMAQRYLVETTLPANEIAALIGYADPANVYRIFQKETGLTPQQYRNSNSSIVSG